MLLDHDQLNAALRDLMEFGWCMVVSREHADQVADAATPLTGKVSVMELKDGLYRIDLAPEALEPSPTDPDR